MKVTILLAAMVALASADLYMHNPRFNNNRLNEAANNIQNDNRMTNTQTNNEGAYHWGPPVSYYEGSMLMLEWAHQHSSAEQVTDVDFVIQYMCEDDAPGLRDGDAGAGAAARETVTLATANDQTVGRHEPAAFFQACNERERNKGLFAADQNVGNNDGAQATRQNPGGTIYGFECQEERDYYPYWHPTPWKDVAVLTSNVTLCDDFQTQSQNVQNKGECSVNSANNPDACAAASGTWRETGRHGMDPPVCSPIGYSRVNQNGNGLDGYELRFNWTIPAAPTNNDETRCVLRARYNMTARDVPNVRTLDSTYNGAGVTPFENDPTDDIGTGSSGPFAIAFNTQQCMRCFTDRSQSFFIRQRTVDQNGCRSIVNVGVRGHRGNIQQTYPATEYDFSPKDAQIPTGGCVHFQHTGSDYNQANQAGEGTDKTDRSNYCQMKDNDKGTNIPEHVDKHTMFDANANGDQQGQVIKKACLGDGTGGTLDDNSALQDVGVTQQTQNGVYNYEGTRNNNFSNRSQKAALVVGNQLPLPIIILIILASLMLLAGIGFGGAFMYSKKHPDSPVAAWFHKHNMARPSSHRR